MGNAKNNWFSENAANMDFLTTYERAEKSGPRHIPQKHSGILQKFRDTAIKNGLQLTSENGQLSKDGLDFIYTAQINPEGMMVNGVADYCFTIGFRNYNDRRIAFHGMFGSHVFVCTNGCCSNIIFPSKQRHVIEDDSVFQGKINTVFAAFPKFAEELSGNIEKLKNTECDDQFLGAFLVKQLREKTFNPKIADLVLKEYDKPQLNSNRDTSTWRLANAVSYVTTHAMDCDWSRRTEIGRRAFNSLVKMV